MDSLFIKEEKWNENPKAMQPLDLKQKIFLPKNLENRWGLNQEKQPLKL